jgi:hypothetical protein
VQLIAEPQLGTFDICYDLDGVAVEHQLTLLDGLERRAQKPIRKSQVNNPSLVSRARRAGPEDQAFMQAIQPNHIIIFLRNGVAISKLRVQLEPPGLREAKNQPKKTHVGRQELKRMPAITGLTFPSRASILRVAGHGHGLIRASTQIVPGYTTACLPLPRFLRTSCRS